MARLRLDGVAKTFAANGRGRRAVAALRDLDLDVSDGATLAIVGPSGCGKTTLLRLIAGLERPDRGRIRFDQRDVTRASVPERGVGFVFQNLALFEHLDVRRNIGYGVRARGERRAELIRAAAARASVGAVMDASPRSLSGGERQRVAIARALAIEPRILVLDEPFASLDAPLRAELRGEVARARREFGATTVLVTHDRADAFALGDAIAVMDAGRIVQIDAPAAILDRPATDFVARFLGAPGLALIDGRASGGRFVAPGGLAFAVATGDGAVRLGLRAERVRLEPDGAIEGRIVVLERDGTGAFAHVDGAFGTLVARLSHDDARGAAAGDAVRLTVDPTDALVFDANGRLATARPRVASA